MKAPALLLLTLVGVISCDRTTDPPPSSASKTPTTTAPPAPVKPNPEHLIVRPNPEHLIDLALDDFIAHASEEFGTLNAELKESKWDPAQPADIWFVSKTEAPGHYISQSQMRGELRDSSMESDLDQLFLHLADKDPAVLDLSKSTAMNKRIKLIDKLPERGPYQVERDMGNAKAWITAYSPLIDKKAENAIVRIHFGPTPHGACGTFFLERVNDEWKVKWRKAAFYA